PVQKGLEFLAPARREGTDPVPTGLDHDAGKDEGGGREAGPHGVRRSLVEKGKSPEEAHDGGLPRGSPARGTPEKGGDPVPHDPEAVGGPRRHLDPIERSPPDRPPVTVAPEAAGAPGQPSQKEGRIDPDP